MTTTHLRLSSLQTTSPTPTSYLRQSYRLCSIDSRRFQPCLQSVAYTSGHWRARDTRIACLRNSAVMVDGNSAYVYFGPTFLESSIAFALFVVVRSSFAVDASGKNCSITAGSICRELDILLVANTATVSAAVAASTL